MCSYLGAFPAPLAHAFVSRLSRPGDLVLDPYCGRGTVPLEAATGNRIGVAIDANPLAHVLSAAKLDAPSRFDAETRLAHLRIDWADERDGWRRVAGAGTSALFEGPNGFETLPDAVVAAFEPDELAQLLYLRRRLDVTDRVDRFLVAALMGILHGRSRGYISDLMPNGFSLSPEYATRTNSRGCRSSGADAGAADPMSLLERKLRRLYRDGTPRTRGLALLGDAVATIPDARRALRARGLVDRFRLVMTSPPYLRTLRYGSSNWLRLWFLAADPLAVDEATAGPGTIEGFGRATDQLLRTLRDGLTDDAVVVLVLGDVGSERGKRRTSELELAQAAWELGAEPLGYRLAGVIADPVPSNRKLTRLWGAEAGRTTDVDQILVIAPTELGRRRGLVSLDAPVDWSWPRRASSKARVGRTRGVVQPVLVADESPATSPHEPVEGATLTAEPIAG
jgi:site-specific DNA-methyltransferase (adenine-specific)